MSLLSDLVRKDFEINDTIYFLNHAAGKPLKTHATIFENQYFNNWKTNEPWSSWLGILNEFQQNLGLLLNTDAANICPQANVSSALTKLFFSLPKQAGKNTIVLSEQEFPTVGFVAKMATALGYQLKFISKEIPQTDFEVWKNALTEDVQFAIITHAQSNTGAQIPVKEIVEHCTTKNIISIIDVAQSVGVMPININEWQPSFVIGSCLKWLCSGPGAGFLYVNPSILPQCKPIDVGWFSHEQPFEFDIHHFEYNKTARRFLGGTPNVAPFVIANHSLQYLNKIGIDTIRKHNLFLTQQIIDSATEYVVSPTAEAQRSGTVVLHFKEKHEAILNQLKERNIIFDTRIYGIRISPHLYNTTEEIVQLLQPIQS